jgi:hypothetical protein
LCHAAAAARRDDRLLRYHPSRHCPGLLPWCGDHSQRSPAFCCTHSVEFALPRPCRARIVWRKTNIGRSSRSRTHAPSP